MENVNITCSFGYIFFPSHVVFFLLLIFHVSLARLFLHNILQERLLISENEMQGRFPVLFYFLRVITFSYSMILPRDL